MNTHIIFSAGCWKECIENPKCYRNSLAISVKLREIHVGAETVWDRCPHHALSPLFPPMPHSPFCHPALHRALGGGQPASNWHWTSSVTWPVLTVAGLPYDTFVTVCLSELVHKGLDWVLILRKNLIAVNAEPRPSANRPVVWWASFPFQSVFSTVHCKGFLALIIPQPD